MAITIKGIRVNDITIKPDAEGGGYKIDSAEYSLVSSADKVLAKQAIGGYHGNSLKLEPSPETKKALEVFTTSYTKDVQTLLGLLE